MALRIVTALISEPSWYQFAVPFLFLIASIFFPAGTISARFDVSDRELQKIKSNDDNARALEISQIKNFVETSMKGDEIKSGDRLKYLGDRFGRSIDYNIRRHDWYEDQRSRIFQGTVALASATFVITGWIAKDPNAPAASLLFGFISIALIGLIFNAYSYNQELDAIRPHMLTSDVRLWFFKYNFPKGIISSKTNPVETASCILALRKRFIDRVLEVGYLPRSLSEDIEQIFILQNLQSFKSASLQRMRWILTYMVGALALQIALWYVISTFYK